jgi:Chalcone isomerase-like
MTAFARTLMAAALGLAVLASHAREVPPEIQAEVPGLRWLGSARLSVWGFKVYDASLFVAPGFRSENFAQHAFALELRYLRDFRNEDIARRSIEEMRRVSSFSEAQAAQWTAALRKAFPDVRAGERITGIYKLVGADAGVRFLTNGKVTGEIRDLEFARLFFGIWLAPQTSEPAMRQALLTGHTPADDKP